MPTSLTPRQQEILRTVVELHIDTAEPISSQAVTKRLTVSLSSATVRNVMAELEEQGYLVSQHTSAARIPSDSGFQVYVEALLREQERALGRNLPVDRTPLQDRVPAAA